MKKEWIPRVGAKGGRRISFNNLWPPTATSLDIHSVWDNSLINVLRLSATLVVTPFGNISLRAHNQQMLEIVSLFWV